MTENHDDKKGMEKKRDVVELPWVQVNFLTEFHKLYSEKVVELAVAEGKLKEGPREGIVKIPHTGSKMEVAPDTFKVWGWNNFERKMALASMCSIVLDGIDIETNVNVDDLIDPQEVDRLALGKITYPTGTDAHGKPRTRIITCPWGDQSKTDFCLALLRVLSTPLPARHPEWFIE